MTVADIHLLCVGRAGGPEVVGWMVGGLVSLYENQPEGIETRNKNTHFAEGRGRR